MEQTTRPVKTRNRDAPQRLSWSSGGPSGTTSGPQLSSTQFPGQRTAGGGRKQQKIHRAASQPAFCSARAVSNAPPTLFSGSACNHPPGPPGSPTSTSPPPSHGGNIHWLAPLRPEKESRVASNRWRTRGAPPDSRANIATPVLVSPDLVPTPRPLHPPLSRPSCPATGWVRGCIRCRVARK
jgi:hypothetical protein